MTRTDVDAAVAALAARQAGAFARLQVLLRGGDDALIARRLRSGRWIGVAPGVYLLAGVPALPVRDLWIAHLRLGPRSVVSFLAAAHALSFDGFRRVPPWLTVPPGNARLLDRGRVTVTADLDRRHIAQVGRLPVTTPARTIVDLAAHLPPDRLLSVIEDCVVTDRVQIAAIDRVLRAVARRGKPGVRALTAALDELVHGGAPSASELERMTDDLLDEVGMPSGVRQAPLPGRRLGEAFVDRTFPDALLIVESDGRRWHTRRADFDRDAQRDLEAASLGYQTLRIHHSQIVRQRLATGRLVLRTYQRRLAQLGPHARTA